MSEKNWGAKTVQWDDARILLAFARDGSFNLAARRLGVRHSTISRRIHALEESLATALIERSATGYVLTQAGEDLAQTAARMEKQLLEYEAANSGQKDDASGLLHVTAIANMASGVLMPLFARFSAENPNISLRLDVTNDNVRLSERDADVALRQTNTPGETLIGTRLATIASAVYGQADYCAAVEVGEAEERWIGVECCDYHRTWTKQSRSHDDHGFTVDDTSLTLAALKEGLGVGYLPCFLGDADPDLVRFRAPKMQHNLGLWLLYHRDLRNTKRVTLFREHMQREIKPLLDLFGGTSEGKQLQAAPKERTI